MKFQVPIRFMEDISVRRNCVIIPALGLEDFRQIVDGMVKVPGEIPLP